MNFRPVFLLVAAIIGWLAFAQQVCPPLPVLLAFLVRWQALVAALAGTSTALAIWFRMRWKRAEGMHDYLYECMQNEQNKRREREKSRPLSEEELTYLRETMKDLLYRTGGLDR